MDNNDFEGKIDGKGELELYRSFWDRLKEAVSAPEVSRRLVKAVGKKKRLDWYSIRNYDLSEKRDDELITDFPRNGDIVLVLECENQTEGETFIKFNSPNSDAFDLAKYRKLRHNFSNLYLTNKATEDKKTLYLLFARGDWDIERHHPEEEIMAINADTVDSIHASASAEANKLIALGSDAKFPDGVVRNIQSEIYANRPGSPVVGDMFIATDTGQILICFTAGAWTDITISTAADVSFTPAGDIVATDVQAAIEELDTEKLAKALFDANTILAANADNTPLALTIAEQRLVGRITGGNIAALTAAQVRTLLNVADGAIANLVEDTSPQLAANLDAQNHSINNLLGIGATPISAAQWGYLGGSSGIDHFVDRGDPAAWDKQVGDFTTDGAYHDLDLSAIVPAGATAVLISGYIQDDAINSYLAFRKNGNAQAKIQAVVRTQVIDNPMDFCFIVACDVNRVIEYVGAAVTFTAINFVVSGWWIP